MPRRKRGRSSSTGEPKNGIKSKFKSGSLEEGDDRPSSRTSGTSSKSSNKNAPCVEEGKLNKIRESQKWSKRKTRANMTEAELDLEREKNRIRTFNKRHNMSEEERLEFRRKQAEAKRLRRRQICETSGSKQEELREAERLRMQQRRANLTEAEMQMNREKNRTRRRNNVLEHEQLLSMLKVAEAKKLQRKLTDNEPYSERNNDGVDAVSGETCGERRRRLQRERTAQKRCDQGPELIENRAKETGQIRIMDGVDRIIITREEKIMRAEVNRWKYPRGPTPELEPEVEDDLAWKDLLLFEVKLEFKDERNRLCEEALEIELGPNIPEQRSSLLDSYSNSAGIPGGMVTTTHHEASAISVSNPSVESTAQENEIVRKRWKSVLNQHDKDDDMEPIDPFNHVQIKIEADDSEEDKSLETERCEDDIPDWIARVLTEEQGNQDSGESTGNLWDLSQVLIQSSSSPIKNKRVQHWQHQKFKEQQQHEAILKMFWQKREQWIRKKPQDEDKRILVDQQRTTLKQKIRTDKQSGILKVILELTHKRDVFSQESPTTRESRINLYYTSVAANLCAIREQNAKLKQMTDAQKEEQRKQKLVIATNLTKEESKAFIAAQERIRLRMKKAEYELYLDLLRATGISVPISTRKPRQTTSDSATQPHARDALGGVGIDSFEHAFRIENYFASIDYWFNIRANRNRTRTEVLSYRNMLAALLSTRRKRILPASASNAQCETDTQVMSPQYEWVSLPQSESLQDMKRFKDFIVKYGDSVYAHLEYKRFYKFRKEPVASKPRKTLPLDQFRARKNERARLSYMRKKQGLALVNEKRSKKKIGENQKRSSVVPSNVATSSNNNDYSRDGYTDSGAGYDGDSNNVPLDSYEIDSVIRNDILNLGANSGNNQQVFSQQQFSLCHSLAMQAQGSIQMPYENSYSSQSQASTYQSLHPIQHCNQQIGHLNLVDQFVGHMNTNFNSQMQWNQNSQRSSNAQIDHNPHSEFATIDQQSFGWNCNSPNKRSHRSSSYAQNTVNPHHTLIASQNDGIATSSIGEVQTHSLANRFNAPSSKKKTQGRPKGSKNGAKSSSSKQSTKKASTKKSVPRVGPDLWGNSKKKKRDKNAPREKPSRVIPEIQCPFERNPTQIRDSMLVENLINLLPKCPFCDEVVDSDTVLQAHIKQEHPNSIHSPESETIVSSIDLSIKKRKRTSWQIQPLSKVSCDICTTQVKGPHRLVEHIFKSHFEPKKQYKCPFCNGKPLRCGTHRYYNNSLRAHIKRAHANEAQTSWIMGIHKLKSIQGKEKFWCLTCEKYFNLFEDLYEHFKETHAKIRYCCVDCGIYLRRQDMWADHVKLFHPDKPIRAVTTHVEVDKQDLFRCAECASEFSAQSFLDEHIAQGHKLIEESGKDDKTRSDFICQACDKTFRSEERMKSHFATCEIRGLVQEDSIYFSEPYKCELCKRSFISLYSLRLHCIHNHQLYKYLKTVKDKSLESKQPQKSTVKQRASSTVEIACSVCKTTGHNLHKTHTYFDKLVKRYCAVCDKLFSSKTVLPPHNQAAHGIVPEQMQDPAPSGRPNLPPGANPNDWAKCHCGLSFTTEEFHKQHVLFERDPNIKKCVPCNKTFYNYCGYWDHMHDFHKMPKNTKMTTPGVEFPLRKRELVQEDYDKLSSSTTLQTASGEMTIFSCKVCLKNFKTQEFLRSHISEIHKDDAFTRVLCTKCNVTFATKRNLEKHDKFHHRENLLRYLCPKCGALLTRTDHLRVHMRTLHPGEAYSMSDVKAVPFQQAMQTLKHFICKICSNDFSTEVGLKSHMTTKHFSFHYSTFCEFCGLQMNPKVIKSHVEIHHPDKVSEEDKVRIKKSHQLSLSEIVEMVQAIYEKFDIKSFGRKNVKTRKKRKSGKSLVTASDNTKDSSKKSKSKNYHTDSSSDDESSFSETEEDEVSFSEDEDVSNSLSSSGEETRSKVKESKQSKIRTSTRSKRSTWKDLNIGLDVDSDDSQSDAAVKSKSKRTKPDYDSAGSDDDYEQNNNARHSKSKCTSKLRGATGNRKLKPLKKTRVTQQNKPKEDDVMSPYFDLDLVKDEIEDVEEMDVDDINLFNLNGLLEPVNANECNQVPVKSENDAQDTFYASGM